MPDLVERRNLGHLIHGWTLITPDGAEAADVFMVCTEIGAVAPDVLAEVHAHGRATPPLDQCGHHHLG